MHTKLAYGLRLVYVLFPAIAGCPLIYASMLICNSGRRHTTNAVLMVGFFVRPFAGFIKDPIVALGEV